MTSKKIYITNISNREFVVKKQQTYTGAYNELYKKFELSSDNAFIKELQNKYGFTDIEVRSLKSDVSAVRNSKFECDKEKKERASDIFEALENKEYENKHKAFKKHNNAMRLIKSLDKECCFGNISILKKISKECNKSVNERDEELLEQLRSEWRISRNHGYFIIGEANQKCNRSFDLSKLSSGVIIFKPDRKNKITINFNPEQYKSWKSELKKIEEQAQLKQNDSNAFLPISVRICNDYIILTYDEELLHGYAVDTKSRRQEVKDIKSQNLSKETEKEQIYDVYIKYYREQESRKFQNRNTHRCIAIDMNPYYVGYAIIEMFYDDETGEYTYNVIRTGYFDLSSLNKKHWHASDSKRAKYLTNKRHYELSIINKKLFAMANHYQCAKFIIEDLDFKTNDMSAMQREANRQNKNVWCRSYLTKYIIRRCNEDGIVLEKICAVYSSWAGNIQHDFVDQCNAAIEIARRGILKYKKNAFYPIITDTDYATLGTLFGDDICMTVGNWAELYKDAKSRCKNMTEFSHRWRRRLKDVNHTFERCSLSGSCKSRVKHYIFL